MSEETRTESPSGVQPDEVGSGPAPAPVKRRGRPRKVPVEAPAGTASQAPVAVAPDDGSASGSAVVSAPSARKASAGGKSAAGTKRRSPAAAPSAPEGDGSPSSPVGEEAPRAKTRGRKPRAAASPETAAAPAAAGRPSTEGASAPAPAANPAANAAFEPTSAPAVGPVPSPAASSASGEGDRGVVPNPEAPLPEAPRRRRGRPPKSEVLARRAREEAAEAAARAEATAGDSAVNETAAPEPSLPGGAPSAASLPAEVTGEFSSTHAAAEAPFDEVPKTPASEPSVSAPPSADDAAPVAASEHEAQTSDQGSFIASGDGQRATRRRRRERRADFDSEKRGVPQQSDGPVQARPAGSEQQPYRSGQTAHGAQTQSSQPLRQQRRDRDRFGAQRSRDFRDGRQPQSGGPAQGGAPAPSYVGRQQRDARDQRAGLAQPQNGFGLQGQQGYKNGKRNGRSREAVVEPKVNREELEELKVSDLRSRATEIGIDPLGLKKSDLVEAVYAELMKKEGFFLFKGILDLGNDGSGSVRVKSYLPSEGDVSFGAGVVRANGLRRGDEVSGIAYARQNEKGPALYKILTVNGLPPEEMGGRPRFADLTPIFPSEPLRMEHGRDTTLGRCIDLLAPIGKGQRGLIVSPPKAGKTTVLKSIAESIAANNPEVHLICLLVDERPEEVTDMQRSIAGEVVASTFDMPCDNHIAVSELVIERAKRIVELGGDVVILLDSITRLARAYNLAQPASGRILSGGVDSTALYPPKRFLGAARNIEGGGSLTILASALVDTGSKMDEVIFEEFKGTGNMELRLDRDLADRRIFPAIDPITSGTRKEELLLNPDFAPFIWGIRRILAGMNSNERAMSSLIRSLKATNDNEEFLIRSAKKAQMQDANIEF